MSDLSPAESADAATGSWLYSLYEAEDWAPLIGASRRALFDGEEVALAKLMLATAYARTGRHTEAEQLFRELQHGPSRSTVLLQRADVARARDPWLAMTWLDTHQQEFPHDPASEWRAGALSRLRLEVGDTRSARSLLSDPTLLPPRIRKRHPWLGGVGSAVVPGLGQLISDQPVEAASAFAVVGSLTGATIWAAAEERPGTAAVVGSIAALFWAGNVYGGADAAVRYNRARMSELQQRLDAAGVPGGGPPPVGIGE